MLTSLLCTGAVAGCGASQPQAVTVTTQAFRFHPASFEWVAGRPVRLTLRNPDAVEHDFVVDGLRTSGDGAAGHAQHGPATAPTGPTPSPNSLHIHAKPFSEATATFTPLNAGSYAVYCSIPGHKEVGMVGTLIVK